jgi:hypothetical protein
MLGLIETLEQGHAESPARYNWREFEDHIQYVYQSLLRLDGRTVVVAKDACLVGPPNYGFGH